MTYGKSTQYTEIREIGAVRSTVLALALLATAGPTLAGEPTAEATPELEWELWHDQLAACHRADRIAAQCARGHCDEEALRRAQQGCSAFGNRV